MTINASTEIPNLSFRAALQRLDAAGLLLKVEDEVDPAVGIELLARRGDRIERGEAVAVIHARSEESVASAARRLDKAYGFGDAAPEDPPLVWKRVTAD